MREYLSIQGAKPLRGTVRVSGAKNSALPLLMATLLSSGQCRIENVPDLDDIEDTIKLLRSFGAEIAHEGSNMCVTVPKVSRSEAPHGLVKRMRASFWVLGPVLARAGQARVALPGGDAIGTRPVDIHLQGLVRLGADIRFQNGTVVATAPGGLRGGRIELAYPSVGATHQLLMTAALIADETIISGAAREPEVVELAQFLGSMGAFVEGAGTERIRIIGRKELSGASVNVIGDRIEAATYLSAAAMTGGAVTVEGIDAAALRGVLDIFSEMGCKVESQDSKIALESPAALKAVSFSTAPFPGVATDTQPVLMAAMSKAEGDCTITETVFENRFGHALEYKKFGANIEILGRTARVQGVEKLHAAVGEGGDIRAAAGITLMALASEGSSKVLEIHHLDRGYERIVEKFRGLGAEIVRVPAFDGNELVLGC